MLGINLIVLSCSDIEKSKNFYAHLGLSFTKEQHGNGATFSELISITKN